jgi:hypothetical protein
VHRPGAGLGNSIDELLIAAFADNGDRSWPLACEGGRDRVRARFDHGGSTLRSRPVTVPDADADPNAFTHPDPDTDDDQFRRVVGRRGGEPRQQFPGAARKPGEQWSKPQLPNQSGRRRCYGSRRGSAVSRLGETYGISATTGPLGFYVGDHRQTWGGVAGIGARVAPGVNVGFSVDQSRTSIDVPLAFQSATLDLTQFGFNASVDKGPWTWAVALVHGFGRVNSNRDTGQGFATAGYNAQVDGALTELSYYWNIDQSRIVPKAALEYVRSATGSFQEFGGLDPVMASGATVERSRALLGAEIGHYWIFEGKVLDLSAYGKFVDNFAQNFGSIVVSLGPQSIAVQGVGEGQYGADTGASASLSLSNTVRLYLNYDGRFRSALQSHQGTLGLEVKW